MKTVTINIRKNLDWWVKSGATYQKQPNKMVFEKDVEIQIKPNVCSAGNFKKREL